MSPGRAAALRAHGTGTVHLDFTDQYANSFS
jgi:hypothetical protein